MNYADILAKHWVYPRDHGIQNMFHSGFNDRPWIAASCYRPEANESAAVCGGHVPLERVSFLGPLVRATALQSFHGCQM